MADLTTKQVREWKALAAEAKGTIRVESFANAPNVEYVIVAMKALPALCDAYLRLVEAARPFADIPLPTRGSDDKTACIISGVRIRALREALPEWEVGKDDVVEGNDD